MAVTAAEGGTDMAAQADYLSPFLQAVAQGTEMVSRLRQAADQQADLAQRQRQADIDAQLRRKEIEQRGAQNDFQNRMQLAQSGAQPVTNGTYPVANPPVPGAIGPAIPAQGRVPIANADTVIPYNGQQYRLPTPEEDLNRKVDEAKALAGAKSFQFQLPDAFADALGHPRGTQITIQHPPSLGELAQMTNASAPPAPEKKPNPQVSYQVDDRGNVTPLIFDPGTGKVTRGERLGALGKTKQDAANGADGQKPATRAELEKVVRTRDADLSKSEEQLRKELADGTMTPFGVNQAYLAHAQRRAAAQKKYEDSIAALVGHPVAHNDVFDREVAAILAHPSAKTWKEATSQEQQPSAQAAPKAPAQARPSYKVGDLVTYQGKPYRVSAINGDKYKLAPVGQ
jgi:hypothetical protein